VLRHAGRWPAPSILRFDVERGTLLSMVGQGFGITIVGAATALLPTSGVVFCPSRTSQSRFLLGCLVAVQPQRGASQPAHPRNDMGRFGTDSPDRFASQHRP
jgi:hypothetical protein